MPEATKEQVNLFRKKYCLCSRNRSNIINDFDITIESFEKLLPGNTVRSYANGNRIIEEGFVIFKATDKITNITYYPVFSETVGRKLAKEWGINLPQKMTVLINEKRGDSNGHKTASGSNRKKENQKMLLLIQFARSMMLLHVNSPTPMRGPFRTIFNKLSENPHYDVFESDIKSINTAISNFLHSSTNTDNEKFSDLKQYIAYLKTKYPTQRFRDYDFEVLREKLRNKYPSEIIVF